MIYTGKLLRAELYDDHVSPYTDVQAVYEANKGKHPGKLIVTNAHWYTVGVRPSAVGNYKIGGSLISREDWLDYGFAWNDGELPVMAADMSKANYFSTIPVLVGGKRRDDTMSRQAANVRRNTTRTWWGFDKNGNCTVEVTAAGYTLESMTDRMQALGIVNGLILDGGGSSQWYDGQTRIKGDGRTIYSYLLLWFDSRETEMEVDNTADTTTTSIMKGIDVSQWQGDIDWEKAKADGVGFAMLRAGFGQGSLDTKFKRNISECNRLGIPCGIYWFSYAYTADMAAKEALYAVEAVKPYKLEFPIAFDYEGDSQSTAKKNGVAVTKTLVSSLARAFCDAVEKAGYYAMVYTNPAYLSTYYDADIPKQYDVWLAQWPAKPNLSSKPAQAGGIWQYTSSGSVSGISGRVDMDAAYINYPDVIAASGLNGLGGTTPSPSPSPEPEKTEEELAREWVMASDISDGTNPDAPVTRQQVWVMLYRMNGGK